VLIIPIQHKPDWRHPPLATLLLIALNTFVFLYFQSGESEIEDKAISYYLDSGLADQERDAATLYLSHEDPGRLVKMKDLGDESFDYALADYALMSKDLKTALIDQWSSADGDREQWLAKRKTFEAYRQQLPSFRYGFVPAEPHWYSFFTHMFLHGGWDHLFGNMVFLFLFGFLLEQILGAAAYLGLYIVSGVMSVTFFWIIRGHSEVPLIGASGAISGVMGAYITAFGLQKIRFFYTVIFYFGEFRAPALAVLPLWLGKELFGHFYSHDNVAYAAHFGGLLSGAALVAAYRKLPFTKPVEFASPDNTLRRESDEDDAVLSQCRMVTDCIEQLDFTRAVSLSQKLIEQYPQSVAALRVHSYAIHQQTNRNQYEKVVFDIIKRALRLPASAASAQLALDIIEDYQRESKKQPILKHPVVLARLAALLLAQNRPAQGKQLLERAIEIDPTEKVLKPALKLAIEDCRARKMRREELRLSELLHSLGA